MLQINPKLSVEKISIFSTIAQLCSTHNAINLGQGYPDFDVSPLLKDRVKHYLKQNKDQYAPMQGIQELRNILAKKYTSSYKTAINPDTNITITAGATQAIFTCIQSVVLPGDEVIIIEPAYDSYGPSIEIAGGKVIPVMLNPDFTMDWNAVQKAVSNKTKMILFTNPHNPTGQIWSHEDFLALSQIVNNTNILLLSDEVYEHIVYDGKKHLSLLDYPELSNRGFVTYSFGKTFHATGWKMGYVIAPDNLTRAFRNVHQWNVFSVNSFLQYALADYLKDPDTYQNLSVFYQTKRDYFQREMEESRFKSIPTNGSYFQLYDYSAISDLDDIEFTQWLIEKHGVAAIPLSPFCSQDSKWKVVRFCFAKKEDTLSIALKRLQKV